MMRMTDTQASGDAGFTMVEMAVVSVLMVLVLGVAYMLMDVSGRMVDQAQATSIASDEARIALDRMGQELRQSMEITDTAGVFAGTAGMGTRQMILYCDLKHDNYVDRITYYMSGQSLMRKETSATTQIGVTSAPAWRAETTPKAVVARISPTYTGAIFTYFKPDGTAATTPAAASAVNVHIVDQVISGKVTVNVDMSSYTRIRSVLNSIN